MGMVIASPRLEFTNRGEAMSNPKTFLIVLSCAIGLVLSACGGGSSEEVGSTGGDTLPAKILSWEPPTSYSDGTPLDPNTELDRYEIYINQDGNFSDTDDENAVLSAINQTTGQVTTSFDLSALSDWISAGVTYQVSIRAVAKSGLKSDFSYPATFSY
jgi:hypothetical protein